MYVYLRLRAVSLTNLKHEYEQKKKEKNCGMILLPYVKDTPTIIIPFQLIQMYEYHITKFTLTNRLH